MVSRWICTAFLRDFPGAITVSESYLNSEDLRLCAFVLKCACHEAGPIDEGMRGDIAARILARANQGERDFTILKSFGLSGISISGR